jgi:hypothetical protein
MEYYACITAAFDELHSQSESSSELSVMELERAKVQVNLFVCETTTHISS